MCKVITTYQSHSGYNKHTHTLYGNTPYGDYLLMKEDLLLQEVEMLLEGFKSIGIHFIPKSEKAKNRLIQVLFNTNFLKKQQEQCGSLTCVFCGKPNLIIYNCDAKNVNRNLMATADHFTPKARGGNAFNEDNLVVACQKCNNNKGKKIYNLDTLKYLSFYGNEKILLGIRKKIRKYITHGTTYTFGGEKKWYNYDTGEVVGRYEALDDFIRKQQYNEQKDRQKKNNEASTKAKELQETLACKKMFINSLKKHNTSEYPDW